MTSYYFNLKIEYFDPERDDLIAAFAELGYASPGWIGREVYVSAHVDEANRETAPSRLVEDVQRLGLHPIRFELGLVSISHIASTFDISRETARLWTSGKRRSGFPDSFEMLGSSRAWAESHVYDWAQRSGLWPDPDYVPLPVELLEMANGQLAARRWGSQPALVSSLRSA
jgi:predicted DNA-binding transcriptional regulator AlpA